VVENEISLLLGGRTHNGDDISDAQQRDYNLEQANQIKILSI